MFCLTKLTNKTKSKLRSSGGMTLTELLVALAIVSLIGVSLTVGVNSAANVYRDATQLYEAETLCGTILTYLEDEFRFGRNFRTETFGPDSEIVLVFDSLEFGKNVMVRRDEESGIIKIEKFGGSSSDSFKLLGDSAYTSELMVGKCETTYDASADQVMITIAVGPADGDDNIKTYVEHSVTVAPVYD